MKKIKDNKVAPKIIDLWPDVLDKKPEVYVSKDRVRKLALEKLRLSQEYISKMAWEKALEEA